MQIIKDAIGSELRRGHMSLQVPDCCITTDDSASPEMEELPDEWFCYLKGNRPAVGRESGFLHLTRAGYEANKEVLRKIHEDHADLCRENGWEFDPFEDFEKFAEEHFAMVERATEKYKKRFVGDNAKKRKQLDEFIV